MVTAGGGFRLGGGVGGVFKRTILGFRGPGRASGEDHPTWENLGLELGRGAVDGDENLEVATDIIGAPPVPAVPL